MNTQSNFPHRYVWYTGATKKFVPPRVRSLPTKTNAQVVPTKKRTAKILSMPSPILPPGFDFEKWYGNFRIDGQLRFDGLMVKILTIEPWACGRPFELWFQYVSDNGRPIGSVVQMKVYPTDPECRSRFNFSPERG
jgi:hypothetical protein